jgi:hypothetical protein
MNTPPNSQNALCAENTQKCSDEVPKSSLNPFLSYCEEVSEQENDVKEDDEKMFIQPLKRHEFVDSEAEISGEAASLNDVSMASAVGRGFLTLLRKWCAFKEFCDVVFHSFIIRHFLAGMGRFAHRGYEYARVLVAVSFDCHARHAHSSRQHTYTRHGQVVDHQSPFGRHIRR